MASGKWQVGTEAMSKMPEMAASAVFPDGRWRRAWYILRSHPTVFACPTLLSHAHAQGDVSLRLLSNYGANREMKDGCDLTPLELARDNEFDSCIWVLEDNAICKEDQEKFVEALNNEYRVSRKRVSHAMFEREEGDFENVNAGDIDHELLEEAQAAAEDAAALRKQATAKGESAGDGKQRRAGVKIRKPETNSKGLPKVRVPACPPELRMQEHKILPFAKLNFKRKFGGPKPILNLVSALKETQVNERRRHRLANNVEIGHLEAGRYSLAMLAKADAIANGERSAEMEGPSEHYKKKLRQGEELEGAEEPATTVLPALPIAVGDEACKEN